MKRIGLIVYFICLIFLIIKFLNISIGNVSALIEAYGLDFTFDELTRMVVFNGLFIEPIFILVSILGFAIRKRIGFVLAMVYPYYIITLTLLEILELPNYFGAINPPVISFALFILVGANYNQTTQILVKSPDFRLRLYSNLISLAIGLTLNIALANLYLIN